MFENFSQNLDQNTERAFDSLLQDNLLRSYSSKGKIFYGINVDRLQEIRLELFAEKIHNSSTVIQPFDKNFVGLNYKFEAETNQWSPNKGKYHHFTKNDDDSYWITVVKTKGNLKSTRLVLGSLNDPRSRLNRILKAIEKISYRRSNGNFIKKNIEDVEPRACGNTRQYSRAAFDILQYLGIIRAITSKGKSPVFSLVGKNSNQRTLIEIFSDISEREALII